MVELVEPCKALDETGAATTLSRPAVLDLDGTLVELRGAWTRRRYDERRTVAVAQLVEPRVVVPVVGGSSPLCHPST
jgi:hypothetical protein